MPSDIPTQVHYLNLKDNALTSLSYVPPHLPNLRALDLSGNEITLVSKFPNLPNLRVLDLSRNKIQSFHEDVFVELPHLEDLNLHANLLNDATGLLNSLPGLLMLNVSNNRLSQLNSAMTHDDSVNPNVSNQTVLMNSSIRILDAQYNQLNSLPNLLMFPNVQSLNLRGNQIEHLERIYKVDAHYHNHTGEQNITSTKTTVSNTSTVFRTVTELDFSANRINYIGNKFFTMFPNLQVLDLSDNNIDDLAHVWETKDAPACRSLRNMNLGNNAFHHFPNDMFESCCPNLTVLDISNQDYLTHINSRSFKGLSSLRTLNLSNCSHLSYINARALSLSSMLQDLDLSYTALKSMHPALLPQTLTDLDLRGVELDCTCDTSWLQDFNVTHLTIQPKNLTCTTHTGELVNAVFDFPPLNCTPANILTVPTSKHLSYEIGASAMFDCLVEGKPAPHITWVVTNSEHEFVYHPAFLDHSELLDPDNPLFHQHHYWHGLTKYFHHIPLNERVFVLKNGSLYIDYVTRTDAGQYECFAENEHGNSTLIRTVTLNYHAIIETQIWCLIIGFGSALSFLLFGMIAGLTRWLAHFCSRKEREKRRSIWELMVTIQEYKTEKVDVFRAYKDAKLDKISAFKNHKVDKLRVYKQHTVTNILVHMHSMREHYQCQMAKIKDNYSEQAHRLRDNYSQQITKIKDYRTEKVERIRDQYQCQALKIRDYGAAQMQRLREQYKLQQQHMLKLLELLDIGNCMSVIEAECMRTESMLFDPNLTFDLDDTDNPVHVPLPNPSVGTPASDDSEYITACSVSGDNTSHDAVSVSPRTSPRSKPDKKRRSSSSSDNTDSSLDHSILTANLDPEIQQMLLENTVPNPRPPRRQRRKRRRHTEHGAQCPTSQPASSPPPKCPHCNKPKKQGNGTTGDEDKKPQSSSEQRVAPVAGSTGANPAKQQPQSPQGDSIYVVEMDSEHSKLQHTAESIV